MSQGHHRRRHTRAGECAFPLHLRARSADTKVAQPAVSFGGEWEGVQVVFFRGDEMVYWKRVNTNAVRDEYRVRVRASVEESWPLRLSAPEKDDDENDDDDAHPFVEVSEIVAHAFGGPRNATMPVNGVATGSGSEGTVTVRLRDVDQRDWTEVKVSLESLGAVFKWIPSDHENWGSKFIGRYQKELLSRRHVQFPYEQFKKPTPAAKGMRMDVSHLLAAGLRIMHAEEKNRTKRPQDGNALDTYHQLLAKALAGPTRGTPLTMLDALKFMCDYEPDGTRCDSYYMPFLSKQDCEVVRGDCEDMAMFALSVFYKCMTVSLWPERAACKNMSDKTYQGLRRLRDKSVEAWLFGVMKCIILDKTGKLSSHLVMVAARRNWVKSSVDATCTGTGQINDRQTRGPFYQGEGPVIRVVDLTTKELSSEETKMFDLEIDIPEAPEDDKCGSGLSGTRLAPRTNTSYREAERLVLFDFSDGVPEGVYDMDYTLRSSRTPTEKDLPQPTVEDLLTKTSGIPNSAVTYYYALDEEVLGIYTKCLPRHYGYATPPGGLVPNKEGTERVYLTGENGVDSFGVHQGARAGVVRLSKTAKVSYVDVPLAVAK